MVDPPTTPYAELTVGVPRETYTNERRVAITPPNVALLKKKGFGKVLARVKTVLRTKRLSTSGAKADPAATAEKKGKEAAKR